MLVVASLECGKTPIPEKGTACSCWVDPWLGHKPNKLWWSELRLLSGTKRQHALPRSPCRVLATKRTKCTRGVNVRFRGKIRHQSGADVTSACDTRRPKV